MKEIDALCRANGIAYYLGGGTLIGAIRHGGFLPWDDDADLLMTRENWKRFAALADADGVLPPCRAIVSPEIDRNYTNTFGRYVDLSDTVLHRNQLLEPHYAGEVIDIFILDPVPDDDEALRRYYEDLFLYADLINPYFQYSARVLFNRHRLPLHLLCMKFIGKDRMLSIFEKRLFSFPSDCPKLALRWAGNILVSDASWYGQPVDVMFEDTAMMAPRHYVDYLIWHYGDEWMYVPDHAEQSGHDTVYCEGLGAAAFQKRYLKYIDAAATKRSYRVRKRGTIRSRGKVAPYADSRVAFKAAMALLEMKEKCAGADIKALLDNARYDILSDLLDDYLESQTNRATIGRDDYRSAFRYQHPILIDAEGIVFDAAIYVLTYTNRLGMAHRLISIKEKQAGAEALSNRVKRVREAIALLRRAASLHEDSALSEAEPLADAALELLADNPTALKRKISIMTDRNAADAEILSFIERLKKAAPNDRDALRYEADILLRRGEREEAVRRYLESLEGNLNGMTQLTVRRILRGLGEQTGDYTIARAVKSADEGDAEDAAEDTYEYALEENA
jgi:lipopolysaccharide cholinephosphotransferase